MNNLLLLGLGVVVLFFVMNGSKGKGKSKSGSLSKSVSKALEGNGALILLAVGAVVLFMCMNKGLVEGKDGGKDEGKDRVKARGDTNCKIDVQMNVLDYIRHINNERVRNPTQTDYTIDQQGRAMAILEEIKKDTVTSDQLCNNITPSCKKELRNGLDKFLSCITTQLGGKVEDDVQDKIKELKELYAMEPDDGN